MSDSRSCILFLNSKNRTKGSINDFYMTLNDGAIRATKDFQIKMSVIDFSINRSYYTVEDNIIFNLNNLTTLETTPFIIESGYYDVYTFRQYLLATILIGWKIFYNIGTNTYTMTPPINDINTYSFTFEDSGHLFGFDNTTSETVIFPNSLNSTKPILMNIDTSLYIHCDLPKRRMNAIDNLSSSDFVESDILCSIPMTVQPFGNITKVGNDQFE